MNKRQNECMTWSSESMDFVSLQLREGVKQSGVGRIFYRKDLFPPLLAKQGCDLWDKSWV